MNTYIKFLIILTLAACILVLNESNEEHSRDTDSRETDA